MSDEGFVRAVGALGELTGSVNALRSEVVQSEALRTEKIKWIQRLMYVLVPAVILMLVLAISNFVLLSRINATARDASSTNTLLLGCLQPGTTCSDQNRRQTAAALDQIRQTQFAIALCQRQNPIDKDPDGTRLVECVQQYYPNFTLPPKAAAGPSPSVTH
jgi:hypothetical protein